MKNNFNLLAIPMLISAVVTLVHAESHTTIVVNNCTNGTPQLNVNGPADHTSMDIWNSTMQGLQLGYAYLDTGNCEGGATCALVEFSLSNNQQPNEPASSGGISLIPPQNFNAPIELQFSGGCNRVISCSSENCQSAYRNESEAANKKMTCDDYDVSLQITFCP